MKIAMIGHKRIPSREGGVEIVVEELSTRLVQMGHSVTAYNRKGRHVADKNADKEAHKLNHDEFAKFCEMGSGRIFGDRINLIKRIKADIDNGVYIVDPNDTSKLIDLSK